MLIDPTSDWADKALYDILADPTDDHLAAVQDYFAASPLRASDSESKYFVIVRSHAAHWVSRWFSRRIHVSSIAPEEGGLSLSCINLFARHSGGNLQVTRVALPMPPELTFRSVSADGPTFQFSFTLAAIPPVPGRFNLSGPQLSRLAWDNLSGRGHTSRQLQGILHQCRESGRIAGAA